MHVTKNICTCDDCYYKQRIYEQDLHGYFCSHIDCKDTFLMCSNIGIPKECPIFKRSNKVLKQSIQKKGVWIMGNGMGTYCSNCYYRLETTGLLSICPNCGAQMEGQI